MMKLEESASLKTAIEPNPLLGGLLGGSVRVVSDPDRDWGMIPHLASLYPLSVRVWCGPAKPATFNA